MHTILFSATVFCAALIVPLHSSFAAPADSAQSRTVLVVPISGNVDPGMAAFIGRIGREAALHTNPIIIVEMDTFGGRVDAAFQISDTLVNIKSGETIAYVKNKAISAGALIALSCRKLVMKHSTTIGDCAPIAVSSEGPKMLGEKFQSPLRAKFRSIAKRGDYPQTLAEAMVTAEMIVYKVILPDTVLYIDSLEYGDMPARQKARVVSKKTIVAAGELLTMDDQEAQEYGFSQMSVDNIEDMLSKMGITNYSIVRMEESWSESFVRFIGTIAPILMMIGFAALYTEMKTPGFGIPGIVGIVCLGLVFAGQYLVGLADYTELLFIVLGAVLLAVELFVTPGFGLVGIAGLMIMAIGMVLSFQGFVVPKPEFPWQRELLQKNILTVLGSLLGSFVLIILFFRYMLPQLSRLMPGPYLSATLAQSHVDSDKKLEISAGDSGVVVKPLRPSGSARIGGRVYDVITDGEFIDKDEHVVVAQIQANHIIVARNKDNAS
jgi:membrane-bound serine protease (ClpP class)